MKCKQEAEALRVRKRMQETRPVIWKQKAEAINSSCCRITVFILLSREATAALCFEQIRIRFEVVRL